MVNWTVVTGGTKRHPDVLLFALSPISALRDRTHARTSFPGTALETHSTYARVTKWPILKNVLLLVVTIYNKDRQSTHVLLAHTQDKDRIIRIEILIGREGSIDRMGYAMAPASLRIQSKRETGREGGTDFILYSKAD